jgi:hypothetical protein
MSGLRWLAAGVLLYVHACPALAQTTSSVSSPLVTEGNRSLQLGLATGFAEDDAPTRNAARMLYDHALSGRTQLRAQASFDDRTSDGLAFSFLQLAWTQEITPEANRFWNSAIRTEVRFAEGSRPEQLAVNWFNQFNLGDGWRIRANGQVMGQSGDRARDGAFLQTRFQIGRQAPNGFYAGVDMFNTYGSITALGQFDEQVHSAGPMVGMRLSPHFRVNAGALAGLSDAAPDAEFRVWGTWTIGDHG